MRKTVLTITAILIATVSAFSQSDTETRRIKTTALQIYENYKVVMSDLYSKNDYTEDNFMALFDENAQLYNDIIPDNTPQQLSPAAYYAKFKENINRIYPVFSDFEMEEPVADGDKWDINCKFKRTTRFRTQKDMKYPEWTFNYTMTITMDRRYDDNKKVYENAKITSIDVDNPLKKFFIIENKEKLSLADAKSGKTLAGWDKEYQSRIFDDRKITDIRISESDNDENIFEYSTSGFSPNKTDKNFYQPYIQTFKKNIFGVGVSYGISSAFSLSLFFGKQIAHKNKSTLFFNVGLAGNWYSFNYSNTKFVTNETNVGVAADTDNKLLSRTINNIVPLNNGKIHITSVSIPLSVQYLYQLSSLHSKKPVFLSFELGVFPEFTLSSNNTDSLKANFYGNYDYFSGVEFHHYYNYGDNVTVDRNVKLDSRFDFGILGGVGLWFTLNQSNLLKFDVSYKGDFNSSLEYNEDYVIPHNSSQNMTRDDHIYKQQIAKLPNIYLGLSWVTTIGGK